MPLKFVARGHLKRRRRRRTAEAVAVRELRQQQASTAAAIPLAAFKRVQHYAATGGFISDLVQSRAAVESARARVEEHLVKVFDAAQGLAAHGKRKRVMQRDLALALRIGGAFAA